MTVLELTIMALTEAGEMATAAAVKAVGASRVGLPLPGLLSWLPPRERLTMCKAVVLAHTAFGEPNCLYLRDPVQMFEHISNGDPLVHPHYQHRVARGAVAFVQAGGQLRLTTVEPPVD